MNNTTPDSSSNMVMIERSSNPDRSFSRVDQVDLAIKNTANINESSSPSPESQTQLIQNMIVNGNEVVRQNATIPVNPASKPVIIPPVDEVALKFIFANLDGTNVQITVPLMSTAHQVKLALLANWPENVERMNDGRRLRLLCMGKELNTSTNLKITLKQMNIPPSSFILLL
eukprot:CAMPEP_0184060240 /NCGR_PEP_ID=MMETSP0956-20121227/10632_1 /TAXON_ID=627963 /ORGANISM="Aplanochytrium sp, Strain PBS07" /LENGTH=171 /DNA_ID=CAMNT_0026356173 /DNA_START=375 /DNA_END=891 /DNA_ORIENTATION=+